MPKKDPETCQHKWHKEHFINRKDVEFDRCDDCDSEKYPKGMIPITVSSPMEIIWPSKGDSKVLWRLKDEKTWKSS